MTSRASCSKHLKSHDYVRKGPEAAHAHTASRDCRCDPQPREGACHVPPKSPEGWLERQGVCVCVFARCRFSHRKIPHGGHTRRTHTLKYPHGARLSHAPQLTPSLNREYRSQKPCRGDRATRNLVISVLFSCNLSRQVSSVLHARSCLTHQHNRHLLATRTQVESSAYGRDYSPPKAVPKKEPSETEVRAAFKPNLKVSKNQGELDREGHTHSSCSAIQNRSRTSDSTVGCMAKQLHLRR